MKTYRLLPIFILLLLVCSCKNDLSTPEKFTEQLVEAINDRDTAMFNELFATRADLDETDKIVKGNRNKLYALDDEDKNQILNKLNNKKPESYEDLTNAISKISTFQLNPYDVQTPSRFKVVANMEVEIVTPEGKKKIIRVYRLLKCGTKWKSIRGISVEDFYIN